ncbi:MAG TPA: RuBisCO large subunit C-terminal-like domain-containing protein [Actinopolymorphaceae bacterium]|jgi:ribulose-bisphosphate carboxylase large chain
MPQVVATYLIESFLPLEAAAEVLANEQSTGTFVQLPGETAEIRERFRATVCEVEPLPASGRSPLPGAKRPAGAPEIPHRGRVRIAFPADNFGPSLPNLLAAVAGNLFELAELAAVRLVDLELPSSFAQRYPGPQFGVTGTRRLVDKPDGVLIGTIIKPSIGLPIPELCALVRELGLAGIDFIKDDELAGNPPYAPLHERVTAVMATLDEVADTTGRKPMYAFNITDDIDRMLANHDHVVAAGGTCVMVCVNLVGLAGLAYLRKYASVPVHGHRAMFGAYARDPLLGIDFRAFQKLARLAGVDHLHTNGIGNKFYESDEEVLASIRAVREPVFADEGVDSERYDVLPVLSSGQVPALAPRTYEVTQTTDLLVLAGGGIHAHPDGPAAGVEAMREAWSAATEGVELVERARRNDTLRRALEVFGAVTVVGAKSWSGGSNA